MSSAAPVEPGLWEMDEWSWNPFLLEAMKASESAGGTTPDSQIALTDTSCHNPVCQVDGCTFSSGEMDNYDVRYKVCKPHQKAASVLLGGIQQRFCQQCGGFHPVDRFVGDRRSCQQSLDRHNTRRRERRAARSHQRRESSSSSPSTSRGKLRVRSVSGSLPAPGKTSEETLIPGSGSGTPHAIDLRRTRSGPGRSSARVCQHRGVYYQLTAEGSDPTVDQGARAGPSEDSGGSQAWPVGSEGARAAERQVQPDSSTGERGRSSEQESVMLRASSGPEVGSKSPALPEEIFWNAEFEDVLDLGDMLSDKELQSGTDIVDCVPPFAMPLLSEHLFRGPAQGTSSPQPPPSSEAPSYTPLSLDTDVFASNEDRAATVTQRIDQTLACASYKLYHATPEQLTPDLVASLRVLLRSDPLTGYIRQGCVYLVVDAFLEHAGRRGTDEEDEGEADHNKSAEQQQETTQYPINPIGDWYSWMKSPLPNTPLLAQLGSILAYWDGRTVKHSVQICPGLRPQLTTALPALLVARDGSRFVNLELDLGDNGVFDRDRIVIRAGGMFVPFEILGFDKDQQRITVQVDVSHKQIGFPLCMQLQLKSGSVLSDAVAILVAEDAELVDAVCSLATASGSDPSFHNLLFALGTLGYSRAIEGAAEVAGNSCRSAGLPFLLGKDRCLAQQRERTILRYLLTGACADTAADQALGKADDYRKKTGKLCLARMALEQGSASLLTLVEEAREKGCNVPLLNVDLLWALTKMTEPEEIAPVLALSSDGEEVLKQLQEKHPVWVLRAAEASGLQASLQTQKSTQLGEAVAARSSSGTAAETTEWMPSPEILEIQPRLNWLLGFENSVLEGQYGCWLAKHQAPLEAMALGASAGALIMASPEIFSLSTLCFGSVAALYITVLLVVQKMLWVACVTLIPTPRDVDFEKEMTTSAARFGTPLSAQPALMKQLATTALILTSFGLRPRFRTQVWLAFIQTLTIAYTRPLWSAGWLRKFGFRFVLMLGLMGLVVLLGRLEIKSRVAFLRQEQAVLDEANRTALADRAAKAEAARNREGQPASQADGSSRPKDA